LRWLQIELFAHREVRVRPPRAYTVWPLAHPLVCPPRSLHSSTPIIQNQRCSPVHRLPFLSFAASTLPCLPHKTLVVLSSSRRWPLTTADSRDQDTPCPPRTSSSTQTRATTSLRTIPPGAIFEAFGSALRRPPRSIDFSVSACAEYTFLGRSLSRTGRSPFPSWRTTRTKTRQEPRPPRQLPSSSIHSHFPPLPPTIRSRIFARASLVAGILPW
jgi:hypothetical protein